MENLTDDQLFDLHGRLYEAAHQLHLAWQLAWVESREDAERYSQQRSVIIGQAEEAWSELARRGIVQVA